MGSEMCIRDRSETDEGDVPEQIIRRPSKLPIVSHDQIRGYKGSHRMKQVSNVSIRPTLSIQSIDSELSGGELCAGRSLSPASPREVKMMASPIPEDTSDSVNKMQQLVPVTASNETAIHSEPSGQRGR